jgi:TolB protein
MLSTGAYAKIYIDISSPGIRKLPVTIKTKGPVKAKEVERVVKSDLDTTGMFEIVDPDVPGGEIIADLQVDTLDGLNVILSINDLIEGKEVLKIRLSSSKVNVRSMGHSIANHIYKVATGKKGVFRTKISYLANSSSNKKSLRVMDWDGFNSTKIISRGLTSSHTWSQDGRNLLYSSERNRKWRIFVRNLKQPRETLLFSSKGLNLVGGTSPGQLISFSSSKDGSSEIYVIDIHGKGLKKLTRSFGIDVSPVFSSDGKKIAFVSDRGGTPQIYIMDSNGRGLRRLTFEGSYNQSPSWSSDGSLHLKGTMKVRLFLPTEC